MFGDVDIASAGHLVGCLKARKLTIVTAESCTGGLLASLLTEVPGASEVFDRGLVTYSNGAKCDLLGVPAAVIGRFGAVSAETAVAMANGALRASTADIAVAITGVAGPGGGTVAKPVGLVYLAVGVRGAQAQSLELRLDDLGRHEIRMHSVRAAIGLVAQALAQILESAGPSGGNGAGP